MLELTDVFEERVQIEEDDRFLTGISSFTSGVSSNSLYARLVEFNCLLGLEIVLSWGEVQNFTRWPFDDWAILDIF